MSLPPGTAGADVDRFLEVLPGVVAEVRERLGAPAAPLSPPRSPAPAASLVVDALGRRCPIR